MELILISDSKLKIMLTASDMENYDISDELLTYEKKDIRKIFSAILDEARKKTGFDSNSSKLFIQVYPSKNGGCEVYVTRNGDECRNEKRMGAKEKNTSVRKKKEYCVYSFDGIDDTVSACNILHKSGYENESILYSQRMANGGARYYLVLQEEMPQNSQYNKRKNVTKSDLAAEYGRRIGGKEALIYIEEHADRIVGKDAVRLIGTI